MKRRSDMVDISGRRFGQWLAIRPAPPKYGPSGFCFPTRWVCRCDCGRIRYVAGDELRGGTSRGCRGCQLEREKVPEERRLCRWCGRPARSGRGKKGDKNGPAFECAACERMGLPSRNGRDAEGRPIAKGKRRVLAEGVS